LIDDEDAIKISQNLSNTATNDHNPPQLLKDNSLRSQLSIETELADQYAWKRLPSYTDRILYTSLPGFKENHVTLLYFESVEEITS
jgi:hypothetical protein